MHLRWSCTENNFQYKTIVSGIYDGLAVSRKSQYTLTISTFLYYYLFTKIHYKVCYYKYEFITLLNATVVFQWPRIWSLCEALMPLVKLFKMHLWWSALTPRIKNLVYRVQKSTDYETQSIFESFLLIK